MTKLYERLHDIVTRHVAILGYEDADPEDVGLFVGEMEDDIEMLIHNRMAERIVYDARFVLAQAFQHEARQLNHRQLYDVAERVYEILKRPMYGALPAEVSKLHEMIDAMRSAGRSNGEFIRKMMAENEALKRRVEELERNHGQSGGV